MAIERIECDAAVVPRLRMLRNDGERAIERGNGLGVVAQRVQCLAAVEQRSWVLGEHRDYAIIFGDGLSRPAELGERIAAVEPRQMPRFDPQHFVEAGKRFLDSL